MTTAYPLAWPTTTPRTTPRLKGKFGTSVAGAIRNVTDELRLFGKDSGKDVENIVLSSNVTLTDQKPVDPGIAAYFRWDNIDCCIPIDRYLLVEHNLQAIALIINAERTKLRHGGLNIVRSTFRGFAALPPPTGTAGQLARPWRDVLGLGKDAKLIEAEGAYRKLIKKAHPDAGGDAVAFNTLTEAIRQAREEFA